MNRPMAELALELAENLERFARAATGVATESELDRARAVAATWRAMADTIGRDEPPPVRREAPPSYRVVGSCGCFDDTEPAFWWGADGVPEAWCLWCGEPLELTVWDGAYNTKRERSC